MSLTQDNESLASPQKICVKKTDKTTKRKKRERERKKIEEKNW